MKEVSLPLSYATSPSSQPSWRRLAQPVPVTLIAFIGAILIEIDPAWSELAVDLGAERQERHFAGTRRRYAGMLGRTDR